MPRHESSCFIAFAGSTITAQHVLNGINNHLSVLRYGHEGASRGVPGMYQILMDCEPNSLDVGTTRWDEEMFAPSDMQGLLSGEVVTRVVLHTIQGAMRSAKEHKIDKRGWESLLSHYAVGMYCEREKRDRLYTFTPEHRLEVGVIVDIDVTLREVLPGELAVLGMKSHEAAATTAYQAAIAEGADVKQAMFDYLNTAIDEVREKGTREIDRPALLKELRRGELVELKRAR